MENSGSGYKLLLSYEVNAKDLQEYYRFVMGRYVPSLQELGLQMSEAWHTAYGDGPSRLVGFVCEDRQTITDLLKSEEWELLTEEMKKYVMDLEYKVIPYRGGFQI